MARMLYNRAKLGLHQNCHICRTMQIEAKASVKIACILHLNYVAFTPKQVDLNK